MKHQVDYGRSLGSSHHQGTFEHQENPDNSTKKDALSPLRPIWLPLKDLFCNHKLEFDISLNDLKIAFDEIGLKQPRLAYA